MMDWTVLVPMRWSDDGLDCTGVHEVVVVDTLGYIRCIPIHLCHDV